MVNPRNLPWSDTLTRQPDNSNAHIGKLGYLTFEIHPPTTFRRADTFPFEELELYARKDRQERHVGRLFQHGGLLRTINGFFPGGPVLNLDKAGGGGASQLSVSVAKSRKTSIVGFIRLERSRAEIDAMVDVASSNPAHFSPAPE